MLQQQFPEAGRLLIKSIMQHFIQKMALEKLQHKIYFHPIQSSLTPLSLLYRQFSNAILCFDAYWRFKKLLPSQSTYYFFTNESRDKAYCFRLKKMLFIHLPYSPLIRSPIITVHKHHQTLQVLSPEAALIQLFYDDEYTPLDINLFLQLLTIHSWDMTILYHYAYQYQSHALFSRLGFFLECYIQLTTITPQDMLIFLKFNQCYSPKLIDLFSVKNEKLEDMITLNRWLLRIPQSIVARLTQVNIVVNY